MGGFRQAGAVGRLGKGLTTGEGQPLDEGILAHHVDQFLHRDLPAALGIVGVRVVTAGAVMGTALGEDGKPQTGAVHDGVIHGVGDTHASTPFR